MLYGNTKVQDEIFDQIHRFEAKQNKKVIFGAIVGSVSKGVERYCSDYDTLFLYLDWLENGVVRWDKIEDIEEKQIHECYISPKKDSYVGRIKIAFWELTSFIYFLKCPKLDKKFSVELYHSVAQTLNSPYSWDPYGIASKVTFLIDAMFIPEYEIQYDINYILQAQKKQPMRIREYLYSIYYALAIEYSLKHNKFAPVYFKTLLAMCQNDNMENAVLNLEKNFHQLVSGMMDSRGKYEQGMIDSFSTNGDNIIDEFIDCILIQTEKYRRLKIQSIKVDYIDDIINIILGSLKRPKVKGVND